MLHFGHIVVVIGAGAGACGAQGHCGIDMDVAMIVLGALLYLMLCVVDPPASNIMWASLWISMMGGVKCWGC